MEIFEETCKEIYKVKDKGSEKATAFHLPGIYQSMGALVIIL